MIILKRKFVDVELPTGVGVKGEFRLIVRRADGSVKQDTGWFDNLVLDAGLNRWGTGAIIQGAQIGTGTSTPAAGQTGLDAPATFTSTTGTGHDATATQGSAPYYTTRTLVYRTALGALNGNYTEVGVGWASGSNLWSRALVVDGGGTPTAISVSSAEQLDIIYRLRVYPPATDTLATLTIGGVDYTVNGRASRANLSGAPGSWDVSTSLAVSYSGFYPTGALSYAFTGTIGAITSFPSGTTSAAAITPTVNAYVNNSNQRTMQLFLSLTLGNLSGGLGAVVSAWTIGAFQYDFNGAKVPKDSTKTLALNFSVNWARRP